jgi:Na+/proline symporter
VGVLAGFAIVVLYTSAGGFIAVAWSDLFQGFLMLLGLVALPLFGWLATPSSGAFWDGMSAIDPSLVSIWGSEGVSIGGILVIISYLAVGLGFLGSPQVFVRFMALERREELRKGRWVAVIYTALTDAGAVFAGMFGRFLLAPQQNVEPILGVGAEDVLPALVTHLFPSLVVAIYIAAVLAAIMSTIDSLLVVASSAATRDFYQQIFHPDIGSDRLTGLSRKVTLSLAGLALIISVSVSVLSPDRTVFWYVIFGWSGIAATFCPTLILILFYPKMSVRASLFAMVTGMLGVPLFKFAAPFIPVIGDGVATMGEMAPAFALSLLVGIFVSK